ncbi:MAG TPA: DUF2530 domain-containing protein [Streptosporangiaceae bacterium]
MSRSPDPDPQPAPAGESPSPLEANDQLVAAAFTVAWAVALVVLLLVRSHIRQADRWWIWTAAAGLGLGLFALAYLPHLKRARQRAALRRSARQQDRDEAGAS